MGQTLADTVAGLRRRLKRHHKAVLTYPLAELLSVNADVCPHVPDHISRLYCPSERLMGTFFIRAGGPDAVD
jgi:hypothetical protein